ncbi:MAG: peptidoglycan DD-metalloendopeptidase family protein [Bacteroidales bacterium]|nr:peptidoglycan DD-metalloendopeptidase family protein [Bacteroidales bacterium]
MPRTSFFFAFVLLALFSCSNSHNSTGQEEEAVQHIPRLVYGINIDSLKVIKGKVKKNEFLADILLRHGVGYQVIDYIARYTKDTFDVRKIRTGNKYSLICTNDSLEKVLYFAYEISASDFVLYHLSDSLYAMRGAKKIMVKTDTVSGTIESSLWNALVANNADPNLANELSEIYAWTIDFFGLQKGDRYKAVFDEFYVEGEYIGFGRIKAARFYHSNKNQYAFYFEQDSKGDYFDEEGNSLQRTFLKAPLRFSRISSGFSNSRMHPVLKIRRPHHGVDYAAPSGTPVYTVGDGVVVKKGYQKRGGGNYVKVKHNGTYSTTYMHLKGFAKGIKAGKAVKQGDLLGYVGRTGLATGPHLDFRFYRNGKAVNPLKVESPPSKPIDPAFRPLFDSVVNKYILLLDDLR